MDDFDFLIGSWTVRNRKLGADGLWETFTTSVTAETRLDGRVVLEHLEGDFPGGQHVKGLAVIAYDPAADLWHHAWLDTRVSPDFDTVSGRFADGVGTFHGPGLRFLWQDVKHDSVRWSQAVSVSGQDGWRTNWVMDYSRL
ncbi:DUF1579 domain-containing protein [Nonomuraea sp. NBC_01738]|uniref:DUF1579 family protein n=1 Tax=Nonomuraea sp. NBC_01738 TaxID=2976003 RepID=UPI002E0F6107|nr:DUF1579 domain-containing protein [Nonomuraea sp. NBC_01738]